MKNKIYIILLAFAFSIIVWISVTLSDQFFTSLNLPVKVVNNPNGYTYGNVNPENVTVRLKADGWQLLNLNLSSGNEFLVSADNDSGLILVDPFNEVSENNWLGSGVSIIDINPKTITFDVEKLSFKKLKVEPLTNISFSDGFGLATPIHIYPDSIFVSGPKDILASTAYLRTKTVSVSSLDRKVKIITNVDIPAGFDALQKQVELTFDVQKIVDKAFENIKVNIIDVPKDRSIVLIPNTISVNLRGGVNLLGKISSDQISADVHYGNIVLDTLGYVTPEIKFPQHTELLFTKPDELKYIIKKFE